MIESALALSVIGLFGFALSAAAMNRLKHLEQRLALLEQPVVKPNNDHHS
ncbi:MAG TPA: hypothetical protein PLN21_00545 [Gemmatales bacterium]|nr:hypothetical protein [Gemmatales bacterium]